MTPDLPSVYPMTKAVYKEAKRLALANGGRYHVACILYRKGRVIHIGVNTDKTHPRFQRITSDGSLVSTLHAEMSALRYAQKGDSLEVLRFLKTGDITMARPCRHCQKFLALAHLRDIRYTTWDGSWDVLYPTSEINNGNKLTRVR